jgi:predicted NAD/FAD-dependent oxidoreductase
MIHDTIILGAGVAGLAAAGVLRRAGRETVVLEKSRGLGGRAATRRWDGLPVDHGAQFFTARSPEFTRQVDDWLARGVCHEWTRGFHRYREGELSPPDGDNHPRYACREGMSALGRALASQVDAPIERQAKITAIRGEHGVWILTDEDGREFRARSLAVTAPPPQGETLLAESAPAAAELLRGIAMNPCLAVVARFPRRDLAWRGIQADDSSVSWIGHDTSKRPDLHEGKTIVVVHASPAFSRKHYAAEEGEIIATLLARTSEISGDDLRSPEAVFLQRWRYAQPVAPREGGHAVSVEAPAPLVLAGECLAGGKIEGAWLSGIAAGEMLLSRFVAGDGDATVEM